MELFFVLDSPFEFLLANLALHFSPSVRGYAVVVLAYDFVLEPSLQTKEVNELTAAAGMKPYVVHFFVGDVIQVAVLANVLILLAAVFLCGVLLAGRLMKEILRVIILMHLVSFGGQLGAGLGSYLRDFELEPSESDHVVLQHSVASLTLSVSILKGPYYDEHLKTRVFIIFRRNNKVLIYLTRFLHERERGRSVNLLLENLLGYAENVILLSDHLNRSLDLELFHFVKIVLVVEKSMGFFAPSDRLDLDHTLVVRGYQLGFFFHEVVQFHIII